MAMNRQVDTIEETEVMTKSANSRSRSWSQQGLSGQNKTGGGGSESMSLFVLLEELLSVF